MFEMSIFWLRVATTLYAVGLLHAIFVVLRKKSPLDGLAQVAFRVAVVVHAVAIVELSKAVGHIPADNFYQTISLCALLIALVFLLVDWRYQFPSLSVGIFPLVFLMTQIGAMELPVSPWSDRGVREVWLTLHVVLILIGIAALLVTALSSLFYLVQERRLKSKKSGTFFDRLPPLATLDNLISSSMGIAFVFITLGVILATTWAFVEHGTSWISDGKIVLSLVTWALCLVMVFLRASAGWRGRKAAWMALVVLGCSALTWAAHVGLRPTLLR